MDIETLIATAKKTRLQAYTPYSHFKVGAVAVGKSGAIYAGCNIENASFGLSMCAERVAMFKGIAAGETGFSQLVVVGQTAGPISPCGACRQVMSEFMAAQTPITLTNLDGAIKTMTLTEILPGAFLKGDLSNDK